VITGPDPSRIARSGLIITAEGQKCFHCGDAVTGKRIASYPQGFDKGGTA